MTEQILKFETEVTGHKGLHFSSTIRTHKLEIDEPKELGGTDQGPNPVELVLAALGGCQAIVLKFYGQKLNVNIESVKTTIKGDLDIGGFLGVSGIRPGFQEVRATTTVIAKGDPDKIKELLKIAEQRCPVLDILKNGIPVHTEIKIQ